MQFVNTCVLRMEPGLGPVIMWVGWEMAVVTSCSILKKLAVAPAAKGEALPKHRMCLSRICLQELLGEDLNIINLLGRRIH